MNANRTILTLAAVLGFACAAAPLTAGTIEAAAGSITHSHLDYCGGTAPGAYDCNLAYVYPGYGAVLFTSASANGAATPGAATAVASSYINGDGVFGDSVSSFSTATWQDDIGVFWTGGSDYAWIHVVAGVGASANAAFPGIAINGGGGYAYAFGAATAIASGGLSGGGSCYWNAADNTQVDGVITSSGPCVWDMLVQRGGHITLTAGASASSEAYGTLIAVEGGASSGAHIDFGSVRLTDFSSGLGLSGLMLLGANGFDYAATTVPEPATWLLCGVGLIAASLIRRTSRRGSDSRAGRDQ